MGKGEQGRPPGTTPYGTLTFRSRNKKETRKGNWKRVLIKKVENSFRELAEVYDEF